MKLFTCAPKPAYGALLASLLTAAALLPSAQAASQSWSGATDGNWGTGTNWSNNAAPGAITGTANGDTATFNSNPSNKLITVDANRNIKNITFDLAACGAFTIGSGGANGGNALLLTTGGLITVINKVLTAQTINAPLIIQGNNGTYSVDASGGTGGTIALNGNISAAAGNATLNLIGAYQPAGALVNVVGGVIGNGSATSLSLNKSGGGWWTLTGSNTYTGSTSLNAGILTLGGADGSILNTSAITVSNATLKLDNATSNNTNRIADAQAINLVASTFQNSVGASGIFSETVGALNIAGANNINANLSTSGSSTLTFASLNRTQGANLNFIGTIEGNRNKVIFTDGLTVTNGIVGPWMTYNGGGFATYDATNGIGQYTGYTNINALGSTIADDATTNVKLSAAGTGSNIALAAGTTSINTLLQGTTTAATVDNKFKTLQTAGIMTGATGTVKIGVNPGEGILTPLTAGGELVLNSSQANMTINSVIADNGSASTLSKVSGNTVFLMGNNTLSGTTNVGGGTLQIGGGGTVGSLAGDVSVYTGATLAFNRTDSSAPIGGNVAGIGGTIAINSGTVALTMASGTNSFANLNINNTNSKVVINGAPGASTNFAATGIGTAGTKLELAGGTNSFGGNWFLQNFAVYNTGGVNTFTSFGGGQPIILGYQLNAAGVGYSYMAVTSGTFTTMSGISINRQGYGFLDVDGGLLNSNNGANVGAGALAGVVALRSGTFGSTGTIVVSNSAGGRGEVNVLGGVLGGLNGVGGVAMTLASNATATGVLNLNGGVFTLSTLNNTTNANGAFINFNGGTLASSAANTSFLTSAKAKVTIYSGGATIDDGGNAVTISAPLTAPTGYGVSSLPTTGTLAAYNGAPYVSITGGSGSGATAIANVDQATGFVTGLTITNPGSGYGADDVLTVTLKTGTSAAASYVVPGSTLLTANQGGGLTKVGTGVLTLTGNNTYTGNTNINAGALSIGSTSALPGWDTAGKYTVANGATLGVYNAVTDANVATILSTGNFAAGSAIGFDTSTADRTYSTAIADTANGALGLTKLGTNTLTLAAPNTYTGPTSILSGTLRMGDAAAIPSASAISLLTGVRLDVNGYDLNNTLSGVGGGVVNNAVGTTSTLTLTSGSFGGSILSGSGVIGVVKNGSDRLSLTGANTFTGGVVFNSGTLAIGNNTALGTGTLTYTGGTFDIASKNSYSINNAVGWNADPTYEPAFNDQLSFNGAMTLGGDRIFNVNAGAGLNLYGGISDGGNGYSFTKRGNSLLRLGGTNTFSGDFRVEPGSFGVILWHNNALQNATFDTDGGGALGITQASVNAPILGGLKGSGNWAVGSVVGNLIINSGSGVTNTYSGVLSGGTSTGMALTKTGLGTQIFTGSTAFSGTTQVNAGTLSLGNGGVLGSSTNSLFITNGATVSVGNGGVLNNSGNFKVTGTSAIHLEEGGRINASPSGGVTQFLPDATNSAVNAGKLTSSGALGTSGTMVATGGSFRPTGVNNSNYTFTLDNVIVSATTAWFEVGRGGANNTVNISNGSDIRVAGANVAVDASDYTLNVNSGASLTLNNGNFSMKGGAGGNGVTTVNIDNGSITGVNGVSFASAVNSSVNITNGGLLSSKASTIAGSNNLVSVSGAGSHWNLNNSLLGIGVTAGLGETVEVSNGGKITASGVSMTSGSTYFNFDDGTLAAAANGTLMASAGGTISVKSGGAIIDSGTFGVSIIRPLAEHETSTGGGLTKIGTGSLTMTADSNFTGATNVNFGKLVVSGSLSATTAVNVASGAELSVNGLINNSAAISVAGKLSGAGTVGAVTLASTATVAPGNSPGVLTMTSLTGTAGASLSIELGKSTAGINPVAGSDYDRLVADEVALNDTTLSLNTGVNFSNVELGDMFFIVVNHGLYGSGTFAGLAQGDVINFGGMQFEISYNANWTGTYSGSAMDGGNDVALLAVPEPSTWAMLVGGFGMLLSFQRMRRNRR